MEETQIVSLIYAALGAVFLLPALWSLNPKHMGSTVGTLAESKKVLRRRYRYSDKKYPATDCTYLYTVNGKTYKLKRSGFFARSRLMRKVTVVYFRGFPRFGYLDRYPSGIMAVLGGICIAAGILFLFQ